VFGNVLATLKIGAFVVFIALGFSIGHGNSTNLVASAPVVPTSWLLALIPVMFTYSGWNAAAYVAEEIRNPGRNLPRALALGTGAVVALYLLLNALYLYLLPPAQLARVQGSVLDVIADGLLGPAAGSIMGIVSIVSLLASISAMTFAGPRVYFAMARDGVFFRSAARVDPKRRTPAVAIVAQAIWSSLLVLSAKADALVNYTGFAIVLFSGIAVLALFVLRARHPGAERPYSAWGYPLTPALYVVASAAILVNGLYRAPLPTGAGALIILAGVPLYYLFSRRRPADAPALR
jgi:APA family basic amino acid/polyamine antiporter